VRSALAKRAMRSAEAIEGIVNFFTFARTLVMLRLMGMDPVRSPFNENRGFSG
jgi:hypothetical protein